MTPEMANYRPGTPEKNCAGCKHMEQEAEFCSVLEIPTKAEMLCDYWEPVNAQNNPVMELFRDGEEVNGGE